jgi:predicted nuclease of predicted toxin-antitoxin system
VRLLLDHHISRRVAEALRARGYDVITAEDIGAQEADDRPLWELAIDLGRVVVTYNVSDFAPIYQQLWNEARSHPGLILVHPRTIAQGDIGSQVRALERCLNGPDLVDRMEYLRTP